MRPPAFRALAERYWSEIPEHFRQGATLLVHPEARPDPEHPEVFLLGMCESAFAALEDALAAAGDLRPEDRHSLLHIWYGSFRAMADRAPSFDWAGELEETILHELTHHWEGRAGLDGLDLFDAAQIENFRRRRGLEVHWGFWRDGELLEPHRWHIDGDVFVEAEGPPPWRVRDGSGAWITCAPAPGATWVRVPEGGLPFDGLPGELIVARRPIPRPSLWARLRRWWTRDEDR